MDIISNNLIDESTLFAVYITIEFESDVSTFILYENRFNPLSPEFFFEYWLNK